MKRSIRTMFVLLAVVLSLVAVQAVWAKSCNNTVEGTVTAIDYDKNAITVDETTVKGIPLDYLAKKLGIELLLDDSVVITAHQCPSNDDKLSLCTLKMDLDGDGIIDDDEEIELKGRGRNKNKDK